MATKTSKKKNKQRATPPDALKATPEQVRRLALAQRRIVHCENAVKQAGYELKRAQMMYDDALRTG